MSNERETSETIIDVVIDIRKTLDKLFILIFLGSMAIVIFGTIIAMKL